MRRESVLFLALVVLGCSAPSDKAGAQVVARDTTAARDSAFAIDTLRALDSALAVDTASIPEAALPAVLEPFRRGETLAVEAWDRDEKAARATGVLRTVDNQIDPATGAGSIG